MLSYEMRCRKWLYNGKSHRRRKKTKPYSYHFIWLICAFRSMSIQSTPLCVDKTMAIIYSFQRHKRLLHSTSVRVTMGRRAFAKPLHTACTSTIKPYLLRLWCLHLSRYCCCRHRSHSPHRQLTEAIVENPKELNVLWNLLYYMDVVHTHGAQVFVQCTINVQ